MRTLDTTTAIALATIAFDDAVEVDAFELPEGDEAEQLEAEQEEEARPSSVVKDTYKRRYAERAANRVGVKKTAKKALARGCGDWLHMRLAELTLDENDKLVVPAFEALLDANGVKHAHWNRTTPGWQGRLRMTGRLALQRRVAEEEALYLTDGKVLTPPMAWVERTIR